MEQIRRYVQAVNQRASAVSATCRRMPCFDAPLPIKGNLQNCDLVVGELGIHKKLRGDFSFERSPLLSDFRRPGSGARITTDCYLRTRGCCEHNPHLPYFPSSQFVVRAFSVPSVSCQFPDCSVSPVAGSPDGPCLLSPTGRFLLR